MSKRKNTLNDLEEFLKLQASTLVPPLPVETVKPAKQPKTVEPPEADFIKPQPAEVAQLYKPEKAIELLEGMRRLALENKGEFYDHVIKTVEALPVGSKDVLLINTALYLKHGDNWKEGIESYWRERKKEVNLNDESFELEYSTFEFIRHFIENI